MTDEHLRVIREVIRLGLENDEEMLLAAAKSLLVEVDRLRARARDRSQEIGALGLPRECTDPKEYE